MNLDEIERRANAATPGPWAVYEKPHPWGYWTVQDADGKDVFDDGSAGAEYGQTCGIADRDFLVAARTDVPALIARVRELEAYRDAYARSHAILKAIHGALTDALPNTPIPALDSFDVVEMVRGLATECERLRTFAAENFSAMIRQESAQMREYGLSYEGVRKVLHEYNDGEISFGKLMDLIRATARAMAEDMKQ